MSSCIYFFNKCIKELFSFEIKKEIKQITDKICDKKIITCPFPYQTWHSPSTNEVGQAQALDTMYNVYLCIVKKWVWSIS